jgi:HSP20 family protein
MPHEFETIFNRFFGNWPMLFEPPAEMKPYWNLELKESEKEVLVRAEVPGFEAEEFTVEVLGETLAIKAEHKHEEPAKEKEDFVERRNLRYERYVTLPVAVLPEKVTATYRNGVLEVRLPKVEEAKALRIPVT